MLNILEETSSGTQGILKSNKVDLGFSQGFITLGTDSVPFLENRRVTKICFIPHQPNSVLTVHQSSSDKVKYPVIKLTLTFLAMTSSNSKGPFLPAQLQGRLTSATGKALHTMRVESLTTLSTY